MCCRSILPFFPVNIIFVGCVFLSRWFVLQAHGMDNDEIICRHFFPVVLFYFRILSSLWLYLAFTFYFVVVVGVVFANISESKVVQHGTTRSRVYERVLVGKKGERLLFILFGFPAYTRSVALTVHTHSLTNSRNNNNILLAVWYSV